MFIDYNSKHWEDVNTPQIEVYRLSAIIITVLARFVIDIDKSIVKSIWKCKGSKINKINF